MICRNGRPKLDQDQDRKLFAESAGTCLFCNTSLFTERRIGGSSLPIAERAHVVAHSRKGPRGNSQMSNGDRSTPTNIVLLCPTCHTIVDNDPTGYPAELLLAKKQARTAAVERIGGVPIFTSRNDARKAVETILDKNEAIFRAAGPDPSNGSLHSTEAAATWRECVLGNIIPGNELILATVEMNPDLTTKADRRAAELLRLHTAGLARKHRSGEIIGYVSRFPEEALQIFAGAV